MKSAAVSPNVDRASSNDWRRRFLSSTVALIMVLGSCIGTDSETPLAESDEGSEAEQLTELTSGDVREITHPEDWMRFVHDCLTQDGWSVTLLPDTGGWIPDGVPLSQQRELIAAADRCEQAAGPYPNPEPPSSDEIVNIHDHLLGVATCLEELGYEIDPAPSIEVFIASYEAGPWHPYLSLPIDIAESEWNDLQATCPQQP